MMSEGDNRRVGRSGWLSGLDCGEFAGVGGEVEDRGTHVAIGAQIQMIVGRDILN